VRDLELGWATDVAVLELSGSTVEDRGDHLIVRSAHNPRHHWGNCVLVTDPGAVDDAERWLRAFEEAFPSATWVAIGLTQMPGDRAAWRACDLALELEEVLATVTLPRQTSLPADYSVRRLDGVDWEQLTALSVEENDRTAEHAPGSYEVFARARTRDDRTMSERGVAAFFGAFADDALVAGLGVVRCGTIARYRNVLTAAPHRRRGLASHLLGVAARWAGDRGCDHWVIVTESTNPAGRIYRNVGFRLHGVNVQAYAATCSRRLSPGMRRTEPQP
jgi:GNAT superfamily N-acetyltransferase